MSETSIPDRTSQTVISDLTYEQKVEALNHRILSALIDHPYNCAVGFSGGKDSVVVLHAAMKLYPSILAVYCKTGVDGKETEQYINRLAEEWGINLYIAEPKQGITFWSIVEKYGWPTFRLDKKVNFRVPKCCIDLKEKPANDTYKMFDVKLIMTGVTAAESRNRWMVMKRNANKAISSGICKDDMAGRGVGARYTMANGTEKLHPIIDFTVDEVFRYCDDNKIPLNPIYEKSRSLRVGCLPCTSYISWKDTLAVTDPKMLKYILKEKDGQYQLTDRKFVGVVE